MTYNEFKQLETSLKDLFEKLKTETLNISSYIIINWTRLHDGRTLKERIEAKNNVNITDIVKVFD
jgi:hypothetical protein